MAGVDGLLERVRVERRAIAHGTVIGDGDGPGVASDGEEQEGEQEVGHWFRTQRWR